MLTTQINPNIIPINFKDKQIYLVVNETIIQETFKGQTVLIVFNYNNLNLEVTLNQLHHNYFDSVVMVGDLPTSINLFKQHFAFIKAGGGVVLNTHNSLLAIYRKGKWDLPKGKLDDGETIEECALREVEEETGVRNLKLGKLICSTYHLYTQNKSIFKQTDWFEMKTDSQELKPQVEEGIDEAIWVEKKQIDELFQQTYDSIKYVLNHASI
jgi:8-oxo-dGTP pyrophosphatase MutT (NUDIX family)